ncbi:MAG: translocation/assembly module TamB domain-containing protein [Bryobacteraceae bacterium]
MRVTELRLKKPDGGSLQATGAYDLKRETFTLDSQGAMALTALTLPGGTPIRGAIKLDAKGEGSLQNPTVNANLSAENLQVRDNNVGSVTAAVAIANHQAKVDLAAPKYHLTGNVVTGTKAPYPAQFQLDANGLRIEDLPVQMAEPVTGTVTASLKGTADLQKLEAARVQASIPALNLTFRGQPIQNDGPIEASLADGVLSVQRAAILAAGSKLSLQGDIPLDVHNKPSALTVNGQFDLAKLSVFAPPEQGVKAEGQATLEGSIRGTLKQLDPDLHITLKGGSFDAKDLKLPVMNMGLDATVRKGVIELTHADATFGPATISASGKIPVTVLPGELPIVPPAAKEPARFTADVKELELASLGNLPENVSGRVSAHLEGEASEARLDALKARVTLPQLEVNVAKLKLRQQGVSAVSIENSIARVEHFEMTGPETKFAVSGTVGLNDPRPLDVKVDGNLDASILAAFTQDLRAQGVARIQLAATGNAAAPNLAGFVELDNAQFSLPSPRVAAESINVRLDLQGDRVTLAKLSGELNGGTLTGAGGFRIVGGEPKDVSLSLKASGVYLEVPAGFRTVSNLDLSLKSDGSGHLLSGKVRVIEGAYKDNIDLDRGLLNYLQTQPDLDLTEEHNPILAKLRFNIPVSTEYPLIVDNNLAKVGVNLNLRVGGTFYNPAMTGSINLEEGGELNLNERKYLVDRGVVRFVGERRILPAIDILAHTKASGYDITLQIAGEPGEIKTTLTSDPPLPEPDIIAVLLTGKTLDAVRGQEGQVATNQLLSYLTGRVGGTLGRGVEQATGLSMVRIEPELIAGESDPTARLTVGQNLTKDLSLIYSVNLRDGGDQIWVARYDITKRVSTSGVKQNDNSYRFDFRHLLRFGGERQPQSMTERQKQRVGTVEFRGDTHFTNEKLLSTLKVKPGKQYDFFKLRQGLDRIQNLYRKEDLLESRIRMSRTVENQQVDLTLNIQPGSAVKFVFEGYDPSGGLRKKVRDIWASGVFDTQRAEESVTAIRKALVSDKYFQPEVTYKISTGSGTGKSVLFDIERGPKFDKVKLVFEGAIGIKPSDLKDKIETAKLTTDVYVDPRKVNDLLARYYREEGFLDATVTGPSRELNASTRAGVIVFQIAEGPQYKVAKLEFDGNKAYTDEELAKDLPLQTGEPYKPGLREQSIQKVQGLYERKGYNDSELTYRLVRHSESGNLDIAFQVTENRQSIVREVRISGNDHTSEKLIRSQIPLAPGDVLDLSKLTRSRLNLYGTGAYSLVDIEREVLDTNEAAEQKPVRLSVRVRELQPYEFRYGAYLDTDRGPGGIFDISNRNSLGSARIVGLRGRWDADLHEARLYFSQPLLLRFPVRTIGETFFRRELRDAFITDRRGFSVQQEARFRQHYILNYGYRLEAAKTFDKEPDPVLGDLEPIRTRIAPLTLSISRESRDDILDATRGRFTSHSLEYAPSFVGSQLRFLKYFGQYFQYVPLSKPTVIPFTKGARKTRFVYAGGLRIGLAKGLGGQVLIPSERFFAGGGTSIRGFSQDFAGPLDFTGLPRGGNAVLVVNNEIRVPLFSIFDGVGFVDFGNVYSKASDFSFTGIRKTAGLGLRVRTPYFVLRLDYGLKLDRRTGESSGKLFFSIGQAF